MSVKNKVIVITGSSSNIGRAIAIKFAKKGARIVVNYKNNKKGAEETVSQIKDLKGEAIAVQADVSDNAAVKELFAESVRHFKTVDILINNAGITESVQFGEITAEHLIDQYKNNFVGAVLCAQEASKIMTQNGCGKILNTASIRGIEHAGREAIIAYSAAKAAVINFTKTLAKLLAPSIQVNAVAPGFVYTPYYDEMSQEIKYQFINQTPLKRFIKVDEIADAFYFLANNDGVTGEVIVVDGGFTLK